MDERSSIGESLAQIGEQGVRELSKLTKLQGVKEGSLGSQLATN